MFSVLLSVYQKEKPDFLQQALNSIVEQSLPPSEIVIVKDGELTEELNNVIENFQNKFKAITTVLELSENKGLGLALREGVLKCSQPYIARMDTDDIANKERFKIQIDYLRNNPEIDLLGSWIADFSDDPEQIESITKLPVNHEEILAFAKKRNPFRHMTIIFKRESVINNGNYSDFLWFEDYELWVKMLQGGCISANIPKVLVKVRTGNDFYKRRSGLKYFMQDLKFQLFLYKTKFISSPIFLFNTISRFCIRIIPLSITRQFYLRILRHKNE
ncbi:amylovoran biosynthesis protein AmsE [Bibersteinia trehalosi Y31]|uniref:Amylovoran biosynthesis protein AmsE n=1 Tax=Bibersteinia trehalosi Y31 TaxID=1261658 RepID=A0A179CWT9_BIBTR|nr:glycosyltransferase [Bibersteinia trehalosi]OAQ14262.1 amylovoran biosynthesis protein AmsE [Bibersteinia trehalosi Y31]